MSHRHHKPLNKEQREQVVRWGLEAFCAIALVLMVWGYVEAIKCC